MVVGTVTKKPVVKNSKKVEKKSPLQMMQPVSEDAQNDLRKSNEVIGLRVKDGRFTLISRKIFNIFLAKAQEMGVPGKNAPADFPNADQYYWMPMTELIKGNGYDGNNYERLTEHAIALQTLRIETRTASSWVSENLLSSVAIHNSRGQGDKNGSVHVGFAFPPQLSSIVLSPNNYTRFSLVYQNSLRSGVSLALYEIARRYATSPSHLTNRDTWEWWVHALSGTPISESVPEYKYYKRDVLNRAIAEVNQVTDINIELLEFKDGRKISEIQFRSHLSKQPALALTAEPLLDEVLVARVENLGVAREKAIKLCMSYEQSLIVDTLELVDTRVANKIGQKIQNPAAYFVDALENQYAHKPVALPASSSATNTNHTKQVLQAPVAAADSPGVLKERFVIHRAQRALKQFEELRESDRSALLTTFETVVDKAIKPYFKKSGLKNGAARTAFAIWYASEAWGTPTQDDLSAFAETAGLAATVC